LRPKVGLCLAFLPAIAVVFFSASALLAADSTASPGGPALGNWTATGSMRVPRFGHTATLLTDGKVLVAGGCVKEGAKAKGSAVGCLEVAASAEVYDPATGRWKPVGDMHISRLGHTAVLLSGGKVLVAGGCVGEGRFEAACVNQTDTAELFDPANGRWSVTGAMKVPHSDLHSVLLPSGPATKCGQNCGKVFVVGGPPPRTVKFADPASAATLLNLISELYDPAKGTWSPAGDAENQALTLSNPVFSLDRCLTATGLPDGSALVIGKTSWIYSSSENKWRETAKPEPIPRTCQAAALLRDGRAMLIGGRTVFATGVSDPSIEFYDPGLPVAPGGAQPATPWKPGSPMALARLGHVSAALPGGGVLVMGGAQETPSGPGPKSAELFDPLSKQWKPAGEMMEARGGFTFYALREAGPLFTATALKDGRVLAVGGAHLPTDGPSNQGEIILSTSEVYTPAGYKTPTKSPGQASKGGIPFGPLGLVAAVLAVLGLGWAVFRRMNGSTRQ